MGGIEGIKFVQIVADAEYDRRISEGVLHKRLNKPKQNLALVAPHDVDIIVYRSYAGYAKSLSSKGTQTAAVPRAVSSNKIWIQPTNYARNLEIVERQRQRSRTANGVNVEFCIPHQCLHLLRLDI